MNALLKDRVAIISGASRGLGLAIAEKFIAAGASLTLCSRDEAMLTAVVSDLQPQLAPGQDVLAVAGDVSRLTDVQAIVAATRAHFGRIDILVNNAGVYGPMGLTEEVDWQEWVRAIEINLHGSVLMCRAVLPYFKAQGRGKVVQLSGGGATAPLPRFSAYAVSKAAIVRFVETLAEEVRTSRIDVNAIAPGPLNTRMLDEVLAAGPEKAGAIFYERAQEQKQTGGAPLDAGARLALFLASSLSDGITGKLISAIWDPWASLPQHLEELTATDIYTLRRIMPRDRGKDWGDVS